MMDRRLDALLLEVEMASARGLCVPFATVASIRSCIEEMIAAHALLELRESNFVEDNDK